MLRRRKRFPNRSLSLETKQFFPVKWRKKSIQIDWYENNFWLHKSDAESIYGISTQVVLTTIRLHLTAGVKRKKKRKKTRSPLSSTRRDNRKNGSSGLEEIKIKLVDKIREESLPDTRQEDRAHRTYCPISQIDFLILFSNVPTLSSLIWFPFVFFLVFSLNSSLNVSCGDCSLVWLETSKCCFCCCSSKVCCP